MPTLSLCLIVRDAERDLERCLLSAKEVVDEIVIVDTGSVDNTPAIARSFAHHYAEYVWNDDFAAARNAALALATGDWILVLDADEELHPATREAIRPALEDERIAAYQLLSQSIISPEVAPVSCFQFRLFRNTPDIRYANPIHEQIVESLQTHLALTGQETMQLPVIITHYGYQAGYNPKRSERNRRILRKALEATPDDPYYLYKLAGDIRSTDPDEARELLSRAVTVLRGYSDQDLQQNVYAIEVFAQEIQERAASRGNASALELCNEVMRRLPPSPLLHFLRGTLLWRTGDLLSAKSDLEACIAAEDTPTAAAFYYDVAEVRWRSHAMLGELYMRNGFYNRAETCFQGALALKPGHTVTQANLLRVQALRGDAAGALKACVNWMQQTKDVEAELLCAELLIGLGRVDTAQRWLSRLESDYRDRPELLARVVQLRTMAAEPSST